jgi:glycosyltransferase involved in cell wall biosynthesis
MKEPLVSVITVVFNGAATLEATLQSVIRQTYPHIDYVIVDGGSTDGTLDVIDRYKEHFGSFISERDKGIYDAMNKGIRMARGEWLYFLGSDDLLADEQVLTFFFSDPSNREYDLVYGDVESSGYSGPYDGPFTYSKLLGRNISHQAIFYKRGVFTKIGDYDIRYRMHADWDLNLRCFADTSIRTKYVCRTVAMFGADGISAGHDRLFLRERLIPQKLRQLNREGVSGLRAIGFYDEWWRFLRNAGFRTTDDLRKYTGDEPVPGPIRRMILWQRLLPSGLLRWGAVSKTYMLLRYLQQRVIGYSG